MISRYASDDPRQRNGSHASHSSNIKRSDEFGCLQVCKAWERDTKSHI